MANTIALKRRITSVKNTKQITKAMELVSASKMRRAQEQAVKTRDYSRLAREILTRLRELTDVSNHPLFQIRLIENTKLYIVITSDRGLAGAYNSNVLRRLTRELQSDKEAMINPKIIVIGKQASQFVSRLEGVEIIGAYTDFVEQPTANDLRPILNTMIELYKDKKVDAVDILYTDYKSSVVQEVTVDRILPAAFTETTVTPDLGAAIFEPSPKEVLDSVTERLIESQLTQVFYEAQASEHSMRMMAMKNATDNANELVDDLTLAFNTLRQASITQELAEITGGAEAIK
jgi:F-type H+-transporting ATPase subunit gamma